MEAWVEGEWCRTSLSGVAPYASSLSIRGHFRATPFLESVGKKMTMAASIHSEAKLVRVPEWLYYLTDEQFMLWCKQRKVHVASTLRPFPEEERAAIFRYMVRQQLVN